MYNLIHQAATRRYTTGVGMVKGYVDHLTSLACFVIPLDETAAVAQNYDFGQAFDLYCELGTDIKTSDRVIYNGEEYQVKGVMRYNVPLVGHTKARIVRGGNE